MAPLGLVPTETRSARPTDSHAAHHLPAAAAGEPSKVEFPMKTISLDFPCAEPFATTPLVMITIMHEDTNKLYASSVRNVTKHGFSFNLQRVDDVAEPDMHCSQLRVSYIATSDFMSNDKSAAPMVKDAGNAIQVLKVALKPCASPLNPSAELILLPK